MAKNLTNLPSDGTVFGQTTADKIAFYGKAPVVQPSSANQAAITAGSTTTVANNAVIEIQRVLVLMGIMKGSA